MNAVRGECRRAPCLLRSIPVTEYTSRIDGTRVSEQRKLVSVDQWGELGLTSLAYAFAYASSLVSVPATSDGIEGVTDMRALFMEATTFDGEVGDWDISGVTDMTAMFLEAESFDRDLSGWDVSSVTEMKMMFFAATAFDQEIGDWDVSGVTDMTGMFAEDASFNGALGSWDVSNVEAMNGLFYRAESFNQDLSGWCVEKIPEKPANFDAGATSWALPRSVWGTCPE